MTRIYTFWYDKSSNIPYEHFEDNKSENDRKYNGLKKDKQRYTKHYTEN
jgi:hypothetical protein